MQTPKNFTRADYENASDRKIVWETENGSGSSICPAEFVEFEIAGMRRAGYRNIKVLPF